MVGVDGISNSLVSFEVDGGIVCRAVELVATEVVVEMNAVA